MSSIAKPGLTVFSGSVTLPKGNSPAVSSLTSCSKAAFTVSAYGLD